MIISAYNTLNASEREAVDSYIETVRQFASRNNQLIIHALNQPIPPDVIARSRGQLEKPLVLAAIHDKIIELSNQQDLSARRVLREHMNIATANMADYLEFNEFGTPKIVLDKCTREQMAAVKSVKVNNTMFGVSTTLELHSKQSHLEALGKMLGLEDAYIEHIATPKNIKALPANVEIAEAEKSYSNLLESIK